MKIIIKISLNAHQKGILLEYFFRFCIAWLIHNWGLLSIFFKSLVSSQIVKHRTIAEQYNPWPCQINLWAHKETGATEHYHHHQCIYQYTNNINIPFQSICPKSCSIWYDKEPICFNGTPNFGDRRVKDGVRVKGLRLFLSEFAG